jgi:hypothetical protein
VDAADVPEAGDEGEGEADVPEAVAAVVDATAVTAAGAEAGTKLLLPRIFTDSTDQITKAAMQLAAFFFWRAGNL